MLSDLMKPVVGDGLVRVSWRCRCGKRLHLDVPVGKRHAGLSFAYQAAGRANTHTVSIQSSDDASSSTSASTNTSVAVDSSTSNHSQASSPPSSPPSTTSSSRGSNGQVDLFIPAGTKKFMLLCVNTGVGLIKLANVDVTDLTDAEEMFARMRRAYYEIRGARARNPLVKPMTMQYIKFQLLRLVKSKECIGNYQKDSIPSTKEVLREEYAFRPCPPKLGDLPMPPAIFMHCFLNPGDHLGSMAVDMLPKKLKCELICKSNGPSFDMPYGWGFYIVEQWEWLRVAWCLMAIGAVSTLITVLWSVLKKDVQGGTGLGQFCIAVLMLVMSIVSLVGHGVSSVSILA
ncbi:hypothetical protein NKR23_g2030 [Pleurostoma richardsiae]|uniref:Uncharacterized protein n=1 Tax=Pleurostoma richardsiae TaxID=41990 RepID=A0AA38RRS9_9PEZI|nr:hypothetical protein NKR23_g2030 [Pleurostoma richardsiae]